MEGERSMEELKIALQKCLAKDVTNFHLKRGISNGGSFDSDSDSTSDIADYVDVDFVVGPSKHNVDFMPGEIIYDTIQDTHEIKETDVLQPSGESRLNNGPNGYDYIEVLANEELLSNKFLTPDDACLNENNAKSTTLMSIYDQVSWPIRKATKKLRKQPPLDVRENNAPEPMENNSSRDNIRPLQSNPKSIKGRHGLDSMSGFRRTNGILQIESSIEDGRHNLQKTVFEPCAAERVSMLIRDNSNEEKISSVPKPHAGNTSDTQSALGVQYDEILVSKCIVDDVEYDRLLNTSVPNKIPTQFSFRSYTMELSKMKMIVTTTEESTAVQGSSLNIFPSDISRFLQNSIIKELIETEATYLNKLKHLIENYLFYFRESNISPNIEVVFGNIELLFEKAEKIYAEMKECTTVNEIAKVFISNINIFDHYTDFMKNRWFSNLWITNVFGHIIKNRQTELNDPQNCESYLTDAIQRPVRYKLLLEKLQRALAKNDDSHQLLQEAITLVNSKIEDSNTMLAINCIQWCSVNLYEMGKFLMKDVFNKKSEEKIVVFLFEKCVVCCTEDKSNFDSYNFVSCIELNNLSLRHCDWSTSFEISCFNPSKAYSKNNRFQFHLEADLMVVKEKWVDEIHKILWSQLEYCKEQQTLHANQKKQLSKPVYEELDSVAFRKEIETFGEGKYYALKKASYEEVRNIPGTFFDKNFCPRIEIIGSDSPSISLAQLGLLTDLIAEEEAFLKNFKEYIDGFYSSAEDVPWHRISLFADSEMVYKETERLYSNLINCKTIDDIANAFLESTEIFDSYSKVIRNKASCDYIKMELKRKTERVQGKKIPGKKNNGDNLLVQLLFKPAKYKIFLEKMQTQLTKANQDFKSLNDATKFVNDVIARTITLLNIDSIHRCPFDLKVMGIFIKKGAVQMKNKWECVLFLFEKILVLCLKDSYHPDNYLYFDSIEMQKLSIRDVRHPTEFQLKSFHSSKEGKRIDCTFDIVAPSAKTKQEWIWEFEDLMGF